MADNEINKPSEAFEGASQGDGSSETASNEASFTGTERKANQKRVSDMKSKENPYTFSNEALMSPKEGESPDEFKKRVEETQKNRFGIIGVDNESKASESDSMTTGEAKALGGKDAEMMFAAIDQMPEGSKKTQSKEAVKRAYAETLASDTSIGDSVVEDTTERVSVSEQRDHHAETFSLEDIRKLQAANTNQVIEYADHSIQLNINAVETNIDPEENQSSADWETILERISSLPIDQQIQVVGMGLQSFNRELEHQQLEILKGALKGGGEGLKTLATDVVLLAKGLGDIFQFTQDVMSNDPRALETAAHAGEAIGKTLVGGIRLFQMSHDYLYNIGFTGDYGKPFRDVAAFSDELNDRWNKLSPGQKAKVSAKLSTEILGGLAVPLGAAKLAKSERVVQTLEEIASRARKLGQSAKDKTGKFIGSVIDELTQPVAVTPDGQRIKIPREPQKAEALHMDRHDEPHPKNPASHLDQSRPIERPEHIRISDGFFGELIKAFDLLSPEQKQFLKMKGTKIQPVKRMTDVPGAKINQGGGYRENVIYLPEEIMQNGHWVKNDDLSFRLRHEIGHALNEESGVISGIPNSDRREFIKVFKEDLANASDESLRQLQLPLDQLQVARDEVYADTYGHVTSPTRSNARYSQLLRSTFPNCFKYLSKEIRG